MTAQVVPFKIPHYSTVGPYVLFLECVACGAALLSGADATADRCPMCGATDYYPDEQGY